MSAQLDEILLDTDSLIEVTVEIDSVKRSDGVSKTWYFSTHPRSTGSSETPANIEFKPYLQMGGVLGPLSQSLSEDLLFAGLAQNNPGQIILLQLVMDTDELSVFNDYVFAGREVRIKLGRSGDLYASFVRYRTTTISIDPSIELTSNGLQATFQLSGALTRMLEETLNIKRYVGIPTCVEVLTTSPVAQASYNSAHDVTSFTVMYKVQVSTNPGADRNLLAKTISGTNLNFALIYKSSGFIECQVSIAGVNFILHLSSTNLAGSSFHTIVWGLLDKTTSYLMIDGTIVSTATPSGTVNLPNVGVRMARFLIGRHCDARLYNRYIAPDEARGISSVRSDGQDLGCVGCWRFDDGGSATAVNDYSPTGADAAWTGGVLNTDYKWTFTDLGEPEQAGQLYPYSVGNVINASAHLIDGSRERYRGNVDSIYWFSSGSNRDLTVKSQGTVLTGGGVDYTAPSNGGDGVFSMTSQEAEPVTFDILNNGTAEQNYYPSVIAQAVLGDRTRITSGQVRNVDSLTLLCPWPSGYFTDKDTTAQQALKEILGESALHYREDELGNLFLDFLLPPVGYGPYEEPCVDFRGGQANRIVWGDIADITGSVTIAAWIKIQILDQTTFNWGLSEPNQGSLFIATKGGLSGNYTLWFQAVGTDAGKIKFRTAGTTLSTPSGVIQSNTTWYFVAGVFDDSANTMKIYLGPKDGSLVEIASAANTGSQSTNSQELTLGDSGARFPWMAIQHVHIWNTVKSQSDLQSFMTTPPIGNESGLSFYAPISEGTGNPLDKVSLTSGTITGIDPNDPNGNVAQWAPKFTINLDETPSIKLTEFHHTHPIWSGVVGYEKNRFQMNNSDIDSGVSQNDRLKLINPGKEVRFESNTIRDRYKHAKKVILDSPITDLESASRLLRSLVSRFGTDGYIGKVDFPSGLNMSRYACGLQIGDELGLTGSFPSQIQTPMSFRVTATSPNPLKLSSTIVIWR